MPGSFGGGVPSGGGPTTAQQILQYGVPLVGAGLDFLGGERANNANREIALMNINFQREMSNTAHQREVQDLIKAGLNPALAYGQNGASTPAGATARMENTVGSAVSSGMAAKATMAQIAQVQAQAVKAKAEASLTAMQEKQLALESLDRASLIAAQHQQMVAQMHKTGAEGQIAGITYRKLARTLETDVAQAMADLDLTRNSAVRTKAEADSIKLGLPALRNMANVQDSWVARNIFPWFGAARQALPFFKR